jgi:hypothetical protein
VAFGLTRMYLERIHPPRALFLKWPFGNPLGEPGNVLQQKTLIFDALRLVKESRMPGVIVDLPYRWRRHIYAEPDFSLLR